MVDSHNENNVHCEASCHKDEIILIWSQLVVDLPWQTVYSQHWIPEHGDKDVK